MNRQHDGQRDIPDTEGRREKVRDRDRLGRIQKKIYIYSFGKDLNIMNSSPMLMIGKREKEKKKQGERERQQEEKRERETVRKKEGAKHHKYLSRVKTLLRTNEK